LERRFQTHEAAVQVSVADAGQALADGAPRGNALKTLLSVAAVPLYMACHKCFNGSAVRGIDVAAIDEVVCERPLLVESPRTESNKELVLHDQSVLQGDQSEK
jgi:hypothetical protein